MNKTEIKEKQLEKVTGGTSRESTIIVVVDYSNDKRFNDDVTIKPYLNGELIRSQVRTVDCSVTRVNLNVSGRGTAKLKVKINNDIVKLYDLNFDAGTYTSIC